MRFMANVTSPRKRSSMAGVRLGPLPTTNALVPGSTVGTWMPPRGSAFLIANCPKQPEDALRAPRLSWRSRYGYHACHTNPLRAGASPVAYRCPWPLEPRTHTDGYTAGRSDPSPHYHYPDLVVP